LIEIGIRRWADRWTSNVGLSSYKSRSVVLNFSPRNNRIKIAAVFHSRALNFKDCRRSTEGTEPKKGRGAVNDEKRRIDATPVAKLESAARMKQFLITVATLISICATSHAAEQPLAQKLADQKMTQGLTNETSTGVPGLNYQGGVAGYAGPTRSSDNAEPVAGTSMQTPNPADIANQQQEIFRKVIEKLTDDRSKDIQEQKPQSPQKAPRKNRSAPRAQQ